MPLLSASACYLHTRLHVHLVLTAACYLHARLHVRLVITRVRSRLCLAGMRTIR